MFINPHKRIFMTAADTGGGGASSAAPGSPAPAPAQPQAQGATPTTIDVNAIAGAVHDKVFAALRQAGVLGKPKTLSTEPEGSAAATTPPPSAVDFRSLDRVIGRTGYAQRLNEQQYKRLESAFAAERPDNVEHWVSGYFEGWGPAPAPAPNPPSGGSTQDGTAQTQARSIKPISDGGTPATSQIPLEQRDILTLSDSERTHLISIKGARWYRQQIAQQTKGRSISLK